jgi:predicted porin
MKKVLIPAALMLGLTGAANAQMTIYGLIDMSYGKSLYADVFLNEEADFHSGGDNGSSEGNSTTRIGLKGSAEVAPGIKANFNLETGGIDSDGGVNGGGNFFNRQAWAGFSGSYGEVRLGRQDSVAFQTMIEYDFNGASNGVSALGYSGVAPWLPGRQSRSLQYISPKMGGFSAQLGFTPEGNDPGAKANYSGTVKFATGGFSAALTGESKRTETSQDFYALAGSYDFGVVKIMGSYADGGNFNEGGTGKGYGLGITAPIGGFNIGMHYGDNSDDNLKIKSLELWINKEIFKNTYAYAEYGDWKTSLATNPLLATGKTDGTGYAVGVIFVF